MIRMTSKFGLFAVLPVMLWGGSLLGQSQATSPRLAADKVVTEASCTAQKLGQSIPAASIGEPVSAVTLGAPAWTAASNGNPAYCSVDGSMAPVETSATAKPNPAC